MKASVAVDQCAVYDRRILRDLLSGPIEHVVRSGRIGRGSTVLLKPNLMGSHPPEHAVTTHPDVVGAVAELLADHGVRMVLGDSPASGRFGEALAACGLLPVIQRVGIKPVCFETSGIIEKRIGTNVYHLSRVPFEVDAVFNLPKLKTHASALYTGAVKNLFGCMPGLAKQLLHRKAPTPREFATHLQSVYGLLEPRVCIHIMDGIVGMDGLGPVRGRAAPFGRLLVSPHGVALDRVACTLVGLDWDLVEHLSSNETLVLETSPPDACNALRITATRLTALRVAGWLFRRSSTPAHALCRRMLWARPAVDNGRCVGCGDCSSRCPTAAIVIAGSKRAVIRRDRCILCLCCSEVCCRGAIALELSRAARGVALLGESSRALVKGMRVTRVPAKLG